MRRNLKHGRDALVAVVLLALSLVTLSCGAGKKPFTLNVARFDERSEQTAAAITISDPQVYSRESLVNDRLREVRLIESMLDASAEPDFVEQFTPELARDLVNYQALAAQLSASFDPSQGRAAERGERLSEIRNEIEELKLKKDLELARQDLQRTVEGSGQDEDGDDAGGTEDGDDPDTDTDTSSSSGDESESDEQNDLPDTSSVATSTSTATAAGVTRAKELLTDLDQRAGEGKNVLQAGVGSSPRQRFRDLQAYRAELRQSLASVNLDDLHDLDGNALYRFQFRATVMPGESKSQLGVARLTVAPPRLDGDEIDELYKSWLNHLTYRMNVRLPEGRAPLVDRRYARLAAAGLFELVELVVTQIPKRQAPDLDRKPAEPPRRRTVLLALPAGTRTELMLEYLGAAVPQAEERAPAPGGVSDQVAPREGRSDATTPMAAMQALQRVQDDAPSREAARLALSSVRMLADDRRFGGAWSLSLGSLDRALTEATSSAVVDVDETAPIRVPSLFKDTLLSGRFPQGSTYAYTVAPKELSQRLSTVARSANSLEFALSLAASFPQAGAKGDAGVGYVRAAAGNVEAIERTPLVVGFADRQSPIDRDILSDGTDKRTEMTCRHGNRQCGCRPAGHQFPQVGWVFGPKVRINAKDNDLELVHAVTSYDVSADVSVPGWWPGVRLDLETAWIGNWHGSSQVVRLDSGHGYHTESFAVPLPRNRADYDGLTNILATETLGSFVELLSIRHVEPFYISACAKEVTILIEGANIWRSTEAYLAGFPAETIRVLPDMEGVAATFDLDKLYAADNLASGNLGIDQKTPLTVWTRNGSDTQVVTVSGTRTAGAPPVPAANGKNGTPGRRATCVADRTLASKIRSDDLAIIDYSPSRLTQCGDSADFVVRVRRASDRLSEQVTFYLNGMKQKPLPPPAAIKGAPGTLRAPSGSKTQVFSVSFPKGAFADNPKGTAVALAATDGKDLSVVPITRAACTTGPQTKKDASKSDKKSKTKKGG